MNTTKKSSFKFEIRICFTKGKPKERDDGKRWRNQDLEDGGSGR